MPFLISRGPSSPPKTFITSNYFRFTITKQPELYIKHAEGYISFYGGGWVTEHEQYKHCQVNWLSYTLGNKLARAAGVRYGISSFHLKTQRKSKPS